MQVLVDEEEYQAFFTAAKNQNMSLGEWVRQSLRKSLRTTSTRNPEETIDIKEMLQHIERGYNERNPST